MIRSAMIITAEIMVIIVITRLTRKLTIAISVVIIMVTLIKKIIKDNGNNQQLKSY